MTRELFPFQVMARGKTRALLSQGKARILWDSPTGSGKTILAAAIAREFVAAGKRVIFCVCATILIDQTIEKFRSEGIENIGVIQGDHPLANPSAPVQICSIQTLANRGIPPADLVFIDEVHHWHDAYARWIDDPEWASSIFIGMSATPCREGLGDYFADVVSIATTKELIRLGFLSPFRVFAPAHPDLSRVKTVAGDYDLAQLNDLMTTPALVKNIAETYLKLGEDRHGFCFCVSRAHARAVHDEFAECGVAVAYVDGETPRDERESIKKDYHDGRVRIVCNVGVLTTGADWDVRVVILARPTKSEILFVQQIGRGLRTASRKSDCLARGTLVLTDRGEVPIQDVTPADRLWDGANFVSHSGVVCRGARRVMSHDGIIATPDHKVMTHDGFKTLAEAERRQIRITRSGIDGQPIRVFDNHVEENGRVELSTSRRGRMRALLQEAYGAVLQHQEATSHGCMSALQWTEAGHCAEVALSSVPGSARSLHQSAQHLLRSLRRAWGRVQISRRERGFRVDCGESWSGPDPRNRPHKQRWPLRAWKFALSASSREHEQHAALNRRAESAIHFISNILPACEICRRNIEPSDRHNDGRSNFSPVGNAIEQTEREVWDILDSGPLQRFTANGRLVHNCIILDHSSNHHRFGFVTELVHDGLTPAREKPDGGERPFKECPECHALIGLAEKSCPECGSVFSPPGTGPVIYLDGELEELRIDLDEVSKKIELHGMLRHFALEKGFQNPDGWAAHKFKEKLGHWPNDARIRNAPLKYTTAPVRRWLKAQYDEYLRQKNAGGSA